MKEFVCSSCNESWSVKDEQVNKVFCCPFCAFEIPKPKEIIVTSFETAIQKVISDLSVEVLKERKRFLAYLMDIGSQYKKEIHILSRACDEVAFKKLYKFSSLRGSELDVEIAKFKNFLVDEEGISDVWASFICDAFCGVLCEKASEQNLSNNDSYISVDEVEEDTTQNVSKITEIDEYIKILKETVNDEKVIQLIRKAYVLPNSLWSSEFLKEKFDFQPGTYVAFGKHKKWKILDAYDDYVILFDEKSMERQPFNETGKRSFWKDSSLRRWLNEDYAKQQFSLDELNYLKAMPITTDRQLTEDKIFILSEQEITKFEHLFEKNYGTWLLRNSSPINGSTHVMTYEKGKLFAWGCVMDYKEYVKPVICVSIDYFLNMYIKTFK